MHSYVIFLKRLLIIILIQVQQKFHPTEPQEMHKPPHPGHVLRQIYSKHSRKIYYIMVDEKNTTIKVGAECAKLRQHGCSIFVIWKTHTMSNVNVVTITEDNVFIRMLMTPISTKK